MGVIIHKTRLVLRPISLLIVLRMDKMLIAQIVQQIQRRLLHLLNNKGVLHPKHLLLLLMILITEVLLLIVLSKLILLIRLLILLTVLIPLIA